MKKFKFRLSKVREVRIHEEKQEQMRFAEVMKTYVEIENRIKTNQRLKGQYIRMQPDFTNPIEATIMRLRDEALDGLNHRIRMDTRLLFEYTPKVEEARERLLEKTKKRKAMDILYEKAKRTYWEEFYKEEQKTLDEVGSQMYFKKIREEEQEANRAIYLNSAPENQTDTDLRELMARIQTNNQMV